MIIIFKLECIWKICTWEVDKSLDDLSLAEFKKKSISKSTDDKSVSKYNPKKMSKYLLLSLIKF